MKHDSPYQSYVPSNCSGRAYIIALIPRGQATLERLGQWHVNVNELQLHAFFADVPKGDSELCAHAMRAMSK